MGIYYFSMHAKRSFYRGIAFGAGVFFACASLYSGHKLYTKLSDMYTERKLQTEFSEKMKVDTRFENAYTLTQFTYTAAQKRNTSDE